MQIKHNPDSNHFDYYFDVEYASQDPEFTELPVGYINKTIPGCGLTTVALENKQNIILAAPTRILIENKVAQYPNSRCNYEIFPVLGGVTYEEIEEYMFRARRNHQPVKVMVTYDSLDKLEEWIPNCHLVIDESHHIVSSSNLKLKDKKVDQLDANTKLINIISNNMFIRTSLISATPVPVEYLPSVIQHMPQITMHWANTTTVTPIIARRSHPLQALKEEILKPIKEQGSATIGGSTFTKVIVFVNSIPDIMRAIKSAELTPSEVAILCANNERNDTKIKGYKRVGAVLPRFTFITSSGFMGCDLYAEDTMNVVISSTKQEHMMINASLDLKQCISRNRNKSNTHYQRYVFIYNQSVFDMTEDELMLMLSKSKQTVNNQILTLTDTGERYPERFDDVLDGFSSHALFCKYAVLKFGEWQLNEMAFKADEYFIRHTRKQYQKGFDVANNIASSTQCKPIIVDKPVYATNTSYEAILEKYVQFLEGKYEFTKEEKRLKNYKLIHQYYRSFKTLNNRSTHAKTQLTKQTPSATLTAAVHKSFGVGVRYPNKEVKVKLQAIYDRHEVKVKAQPKHLEQYFSQVKAVKSTGERYQEIVRR